MMTISFLPHVPSANADDQPVVIVSPHVQASASQGAVILCYVSSVKALHSQVIAAQTPPADGDCQDIQPC